MLDTMRVDRLTHRGHAKDLTPNLSRVAQEGVDFTRAIAASPWTGPSVASVVTGRYPDELGMRDLDDPLPRAATTLAEALGAAGWATAAVVSNGFVASWFGHDQGYGHFRQESYTGEDGNYTPVFTADWVTDAALEWIASAPQPFFLYAHYTDPHDPYLPPQSWRDRFAESGEAVPDELLQRQAFTRAPLTPGQVERIQGMYDASIAFTDHEVGRLLDRLPPRTLIVIVGDHGEEFLEHGAFLHGHTVYEELLHVPLIFRGPGVCAGASHDVPVSHVDIAPTVLDLVGVPPLDDPTGRSLVPELQHVDPQAAPRALFAVREYGGVKYVAAYRDSWKLIASQETGQTVLFDLSTDPAETKDATPGNEEVVSGLLQSIRGRDDRVRDAPPLDSEELDRRRIQELQSLGYIQ
jgi:arylsulfatase A-like enzyme